MARGPAVRRLVGAALLGVALAGCGVRLETPPPPVPTADAAESARQQAARTAAELHQAARSARDAVTSGTVEAGEGVVDVLVAVETAATAHHTALGGVWEPWPGAGPEATAYPSDDVTTPAPRPDAAPQDVLNLLEGAAAAARQDAVAASGELASLLASVSISHTYLAQDLARALSTTAALPAAEPLPEPEPGSIDPSTSRAVDAARYAYEVVAARSSDDQRDAALGRAEQLAAVADAVAPEEDEREVAYDVTVATAAEGTTPERALAGAAELDVVAAYVRLLAAADAGDLAHREAVASAAAHAAGQARSWDTALPALPGLS